MTAPVTRPTAPAPGENRRARQEPGTAPLISLVIPTFNEAGNIAELLTQLGRALPADLPCEIIFVDDSTDDTPQVITENARHSRLPVSLWHREKPDGGLGGAVAVGLRVAAAPWIVVMDADLQHPPSLVPELVAVGERSGSDLVVASRYTPGGSRAGLDGGFRMLASGLCTLLAKAAFWRRLRGVSDPMSGFFAVRAAALDPDVLRPFGYKILLELIVRGRLTRITEVSFLFQERFAGESKASLSEGWRFLRHVLTLFFSGTRARMMGFGAIGLSGFVPNLATLWLLTKPFGMNYLLAEVLANQVAIGWNFLLIDLLLFRHRRHRHWSGRIGTFLALANMDLIARIPLLGLLVTYARLNVLLATALTLIVAFGVRFVVTDRFIYLARPGQHRSGRVPENPVVEVR